MVKYLIPFLWSSIILGMSFQEKHIEDAILLGLKNNNSKAIVKHFGTTVSFFINGEDKILNKFQVEKVLSDFLQNNKVRTVEMAPHSKKGQANKYSLYTVKTNKDNYQVVVKFMEIKGEATVVEFKVD